MRDKPTNIDKRKEWVDILKCPISGTELRQLNSTEITELNNEISNGLIWLRNGELMTQHIDAGLISSDDQFLYPIVNGIIILIQDLVLSRTYDEDKVSEIDAEKSLVRNFYNSRGWFANKDGNYEDAVIYEDLRDVSKQYIKRCHQRVNRYLNPTGKYLLDAASGAIQFDDYLEYSSGYKYRVCLDFSLQALNEAKKKLGEKGIYILADMCEMPFQDNVFDSFVSLNTIYHIPKEEQVIAIKELYRVLSVGGKGVVVYDWFKHSLWMNITLLPFRGFVFLKNKILHFSKALLGKGKPQKRLYFYSHKLSYFRERLPPFQIAVWRSISVPFMRYYIHEFFLGNQILNWIYTMEEKYPERCGTQGEYPIFIFEKK